MAENTLQPNETDFWRRQFALEMDRQIAYAARNGYKVLPITAPIEGWIVSKGKTVISRHNLLSEASETACALAYWNQQGRPAYGS